MGRGQAGFMAAALTLSACAHISHPGLVNRLEPVCLDVRVRLFPAPIAPDTAALQRVVEEELAAAIQRSERVKFSHDRFECRATLRATLSNGASATPYFGAMQSGESMELRLEFLDSFAAVLWRESARIAPVRMTASAEDWRSALPSALAMIIRKM